MKVRLVWSFENKTYDEVVETIPPNSTMEVTDSDGEGYVYSTDLLLETRPEFVFYEDEFGVFGVPAANVISVTEVQEDTNV